MCPLLPPLLLLLALAAGPARGGRVWPAPASTTSTPGAPRPLGAGFRIRFVGAAATPPALAAAADRYAALLARRKTPAPAHAAAAAAAPAPAPPLTSLDINVTVSTAAFRFGDDESYTLAWTADAPAVRLACPHAVGVLRGLETFAQLVEPDPVYRALPLATPPWAAATIVDAPRFPYRGLMMDLARHFYPVAFVEHTIDAMAAAKLSVLHLHLTDDQSFPVESAAFPELAGKGAFSRPTPAGPQLFTYSAADVAGLLQYAVERGVVVVPEFDMPAHASAWGASHPEIMVTNRNSSDPQTTPRGGVATAGGCSPRLFQHGDTLNPTLNATYDLVDALLAEMAETFSAGGNTFLHLGGDEVPTLCWAGDPAVNAWMADHGLATGDYNGLESYFVNRVARGKGLVAAGRTLVYWEEIFNNNVTLPADAIIQAWKSDAMPGVLRAGHRTTNSYKWYLNHGCDNYGDGVWGSFYENDPMKWAGTGLSPAQQRLVLGGETTMWSECVDAQSFDSIVWPRTAAAAEQLWSPRARTRTADAATASRLSEFRCRLVGRGVRAGPIDDSVGSMSPRDLNVGGCM